MSLTLVVLVAQLSVAGPRAAQHALPVLAFPDTGLDDTTAYRGYQTRLFRDVAGNTLQIYLDSRSGRVVHLWADAENESIGFTARTAGRPVALQWGGPGAEVSATPATGRTRTVEYELVADAPRIQIGWFLLGSMRVERDLQYSRRHLAPFESAPFALPEIERLLTSLNRLEASVRARHLVLLGATTIEALRSRLRPTIITSDSGSTWAARIIQPSLDARDTITLELRVPRTVAASRTAHAISLVARSGTRVPFTVRIATTGRALTPLAREEIFSPAFLRFLAAARDSASAGAEASIRARWLERQVRGVELLASREKLMAGLPTYATYFGRDMLVSALMMRSVWRPEMSEFAVASVLRKLSPSGAVSHEEALGGQAVREGASEYASLIDARVRASRSGNRAVADSLLERAGTVLKQLRLARENYHMVDDEFQLPVLAARWLADSAVPAAHKRAFLTDSADGGGTRLARLLRELGLVARMTAAYASDPVAGNLVSFAPRDSGRWASSSWRDSGAGYGGGSGRFAMDVNAIWAPHALQGLGRILEAIRALGFSTDSLVAEVADLSSTAPLGRYARDPRALTAAVERWRGAWRHFLIRLGPAEVRQKVAARLAAMAGAERRYWMRVIAETRADADSISFLALALDANAQPIGVANTDPATRLFLGAGEGGDALDSAEAAAVLRDARLFVRPYPVGLFIDRVGPVVANDAYAPASIWRAFERDHYHGPRVVWGREVNLFLLGAAGHIAAAGDGPDRAAFVRELREAIDAVQGAVDASGFRSELWTYTLRDGRQAAARYGIGADVQLWSTTDLAVQFALSRIGR